MLGNSTFFSRYRYAANVGSIWNHLPSCVHCHSKIKEQKHFLMLHNDCDKCVTMNSMSSSPLVEYDYPKNYPLDNEISNDKMRPKEVTFKLLREILDTAGENMRKGKWFEGNVKAYCTANGLNVLGTQKLIDSVNNLLAVEYFTSDIHQQMDQSNATKVLNDCKRSPDKYKLWRGGPFWNSPLMLENFIDALMHLIFWGVTITTKTLINKWVKVTRRNSHMNVITSKLFEPISDMGLDWCKLIDVESGWVSDNFLGFARVIKWYYDPVTKHMPDKPFEELTTPLVTLNLPSCKEWLKAHVTMSL